MPTFQYLMFRGALYRLAYKDMGKLLDEDTTIQMNSLIKVLTNSWNSLAEHYPLAEKQVKQLKKALLKINPNLETALTEDETAVFSKSRYEAAAKSVIHFTSTDFYLGRLKQLNKLAGSKNPEDQRDVEEPLKSIGASLAQDRKATSTIDAWLKSCARMSTKLMNLLQYFYHYKASNKPNEQAAYKKYVELMGELPQQPQQVVDKLVEFVRLLNTIMNARSNLLRIYSSVYEKIQQKAQKAFTKYMRQDREERERTAPGSESNPIELTKKKHPVVAPPQKARASVVRRRQNRR